MNRSDWQNAFGPAPESFLNGVEETLNRLEDNEMRKRTKFATALVAAVLTVTLLAGAAFAAVKLDIWEALNYAEPIIPLEGADKLVATDLASTENEYFRVTVQEGVYDGYGAILKLNVEPVNPEKYIILYDTMLAAGLPDTDGREIIWLSTPRPIAKNIDADTSFSLFNSSWQEANDNGGVDYWISGLFAENLPDTLSVSVSVKGLDSDANNIYGVIDDLTFTLHKSNQERKVNLIPAEPVAVNNIDIHDLSITFTEIRGYLSVEYSEKNLSEDSMGLTFYLFTSDGEEINSGIGEARELDNGHILEHQEIQSMTEIPESLILEVREIGVGAIDKVECRVEPIA